MSLRTLVLVNHSTRVPAATLDAIAGAVRVQLRDHAGPAWNVPMPTVQVLAAGAIVPARSVVLGVFDNADQPGALGWHTEDANGTQYGRVFASPVLDHGGTLTAGALSVSAVVSHEALEWLIDPTCAMWAQGPDGALRALEVADPVEDDAYNVGNVAVSNFVLPSWFDPGGRGPYDYLGRRHAPFELAHGGYVIKMTHGRVTSVFGERYPSWRLNGKLAPLARTARRHYHDT